MRVRKGITIKIGKVSEIPSNNEMIVNPMNLETLPLLPILQKCRVWLIKNSFLDIIGNKSNFLHNLKYCLVQFGRTGTKRRS